MLLAIETDATVSVYLITKGCAPSHLKCLPFPISTALRLRIGRSLCHIHLGR